jgi:hypothetical protein
MMGAHEGITDPDARGVTRIACYEVQRQGGRGNFVVGIQRVGNLGLLSIERVDPSGRVLDRREVQVPNIAATIRAVPGLVHSLLARGAIQYPPADVADSGESKSRWYGWQTLIVDGSTLALMFVAVSSESAGSTFAAIGSTAYFLGAPIVHLAHGNPGRGGLSLLSRIGLPLTGALVGYRVETCQSSADLCGVAGLVLGGLIGIGAAIAVDAAALAWEDEPAKAAFSPSAFRLHIAPTLGRNAGGLGLGGVF